MQKELYYFLTDHVETFGKVLKFLWKTSITIKETMPIQTEKGSFCTTFIVEDGSNIHMEVLIDLNKKKQIERISVVYRNSRDKEPYLALSFLYHCPYDLELCNQYGLYTKEDIKIMEGMKEEQQLNQYREQQNLFKNNQFYIFNMDHIEDHCKDQTLNKLLQEIHKFVLEWNQKRGKTI